MCQTPCKLSVQVYIFMGIKRFLCPAMLHYVNQSYFVIFSKFCFFYIFIYIYIYIYISKKGNVSVNQRQCICELENEIYFQWNTKILPQTNSISPAMWILTKLDDHCKSCCRNPVETFEWKSFKHWRTMY